MRLVLDARTAAFAALIDYAGLFPPASEPMNDAVAAYRDARNAPAGWVAGRFLCNASDLTNLAATATRTFEAGETPWEVGVIFDLPAGESASLAIDFHREMDPAMTVSSAEAKLGEPTSRAVDSLITTMTSVNADIVPFVEVDRFAGIAQQIDLVGDSLASRRRTGGVKLRCGGLTAELFPEPAEVAEFIASAINRHIAFKATAGLHQPIRHFDEELGVHRHGFVNLVVASALGESGTDTATLESVIAETDAEAFKFGPASVSWRGHDVPGAAMRRMRHSGFVAYGSCDFNEPVEALASLGFLGVGT